MEELSALKRYKIVSGRIYIIPHSPSVTICPAPQLAEPSNVRVLASTVYVTPLSVTSKKELAEPLMADAVDSRLLTASMISWRPTLTENV